MKKITLFILTAMLAVSSTFAQRFPTDRKVELKQPLHVLSPKEADIQKHLQTNPQSQARFGFFKAPRRAEMITDQPEGDVKLFSMDCDAYYAFWGYLFQTSVSGKVAKFVFNGNDVYWYNPNSLNPTDSWIKGTLNGTAITFTLPQRVYYYPSDGYGLNAVLINMSDYSEYVSQKLKLKYENDELKVSTSLKGDGVVFGLAYDNGYGWTGYGDYNIKFTRFTETELQVPEGIKPESYALVGYTQNNEVSAYQVRVAFDGNDVYVQGIYEDLPDTWVKGTLNGNKVTFKNGQYIGAADYFQYLVSAKIVEGEEGSEYALAGTDIVFTYDPDTKALTSDSPILINSGTANVNSAADFVSLTMKPFAEAAATPATPSWVEVGEPSLDYFNAGYGWGSLTFDLPNVDENGDYIIPEKLSYMYYTKTNGEVKPLTLYADDYMYQEQATMTEIPYYYGDNWDVVANGSQHTLYYYTIGAEAYGIQAIYRGGGEERRSPIVWQELFTIGAEVQPEAVQPNYPEADPDNVGSIIDFSYYTGEGEVDQFGFGKKETYDVAIQLKNEDLTGTLIQSISIPVMKTENVSGVKVWLSSQLRVENGENKPDLVSLDVTNIEEGFVTVKLPKAYTIPAEGVYVGYTFTVDAVTDAQDVNAKPVAVASGAKEGGFYIHTTNSVLKWLDFGSLFDVNTLIQVKIGGRAVKENAAAVQGDICYASTNKAQEMDLVVTNYGSEGIATFTVDYEVAGIQGTQELALDQPMEAFFGKTAIVKFTVPAIPQQGSYPMTLKVTKVNGVANELPDAQTTMTVGVLDNVPVHRALLEEYTGTWCGYCPRGFVGLEEMNKLHGLDFVGVSYHNGDPMEIMSSYSFPSEINGFPAAWIDRVRETDAYCGDGDYGKFGIDKTWKEQCAVFSPAIINAMGYWTDKNSLKATAAVTFPVGYTDKDYRLSFVIVENGLHGTSDDWAQSNYYSGDNSWPSNMKTFTSGDSYVSGLVFNDVAVAVSDFGGQGIEGSMPASLPANGSAEFSLEFPATAIVNTNGESLIQNKEEFYVVAMLIDGANGSVINAVKVKVGDPELSDINTPVNAFDAKATRYYDLSGRSIAAPQRGLNIRKVTYSDGTTRTIKDFK